MALQLLTLLLQSSAKQGTHFIAAMLLETMCGIKHAPQILGSMFLSRKKKRAQGSPHVWNMEYYYYNKAQVL